MTCNYFTQPAEWEPHEAVWSAWPSHPELWEENLAPARTEIAGLFAAIADIDPASGARRGEGLKILVYGDESMTSAKEALAGLDATLWPAAFGDIWLRDTAPIFVTAPGGLAAACFRFNGWGGKYILEDDETVAATIAAQAGVLAMQYEWVLEGGSLESDGAGTALTTRQCLLNPNRNPGMTAGQIEGRLREALGITKVIWLGDGLVNDHTDGHVDNIARFVAPGVVACMEPSGDDDPNNEALRAIMNDLKAATAAGGRKLDIVTIPSPGRVENDGGEIIPANPMNFYIGNRTVAVPLYGSSTDEKAVKAIGKLFPDRRTVGLPARHVITGGGSFHCITQQQPAL